MPVDADGNHIPGFSKDMGFTPESFRPDPNKLGMPLNPDGSPVAGFDKNMGFDKSFEVKPRSIIADKPVSVSTQTDSLIGDAITETTSTDKKGLFSRIIPEPIQKVGTEIYDKAGKVAKVQGLVSAFGADKMPDSGFYSQGIVQAEQAPSLDMGYGDPQYFNPNVLGQYYQEMQNMPHGTAALFDTTDAWNTWSSRYTAGGSSPIFN